MSHLLLASSKSRSMSCEIVSKKVDFYLRNIEKKSPFFCFKSP